MIEITINTVKHRHTELKTPLARGAECGYRGYRRYRAATYPSGQLPVLTVRTVRTDTQSSIVCVCVYVCMFD